MSGFAEELIREKPTEVPLAKTKLYRLIKTATIESLHEALIHASELDEHCIQRRSTRDQSTYLHHIVNQAPVIYKKYGTVIHLVPLVYRLAMNGINMNGQNQHGNTALHLACLKPHALTLCTHLIRLGRLCSQSYLAVADMNILFKLNNVN